MALNFNTILSHELITLGGIILLLWVIGSMAFNLYRWRHVIRSSTIESKKGSSGKSFTSAFVSTLKEDVLIQRNLWSSDIRRWFSHFSTFWGFVLLTISTTLNYIVNPNALPLLLTHPVRIFGNVGGVLFMAGLTLMFYRRASKTGRRSSTTGDVFFLVLLYVVGLTGFLTEIFSDASSVSGTFISFWAHMISIIALFVLAPFTKFAHAIGRPLLLLVDRLEGSKQAGTIDTE